MFQSRSKSPKPSRSNGWTDELWNEFRDTSGTVERDMAYRYVDIEALHASAEMSPYDRTTSFYVHKTFVGRLRTADESALNGMLVHLQLTPADKPEIPATLPSWAKGAAYASETGTTPAPVAPTLTMVLVVDAEGQRILEEHLLRAKMADLATLPICVIVSAYPGETRRILAVHGVKIEQSIRLSSED